MVIYWILGIAAVLILLAIFLPSFLKSHSSNPSGGSDKKNIFESERYSSNQSTKSSVLPSRIKNRVVNKPSSQVDFDELKSLSFENPESKGFGAEFFKNELDQGHSNFEELGQSDTLESEGSEKVGLLDDDLMENTPKNKLLITKVVDVEEDVGYWGFDSEQLKTYHGGHSSKGEEYVKVILEQIYNVEFKTYRPPWLKNPETSGQLEIDCYNQELKLGVEFDGEQHFKFPNGIHKTKEEFIAQVRRDQYKDKVCIEKGIYLIRVPWMPKLNSKGKPTKQVDLVLVREYLVERLPEVVAGEVSKQELIDFLINIED